MKARKIVVLGSTNTDMVITGRKIPVPGGISNHVMMENKGEDGRGGKVVAGLAVLIKAGA